MSPAKLKGKALPELREILKESTREELIALVAALVAVEPLFRASEIAALSRRPKRTVLSAIKARKMGPYFCFGPNSLAVPASGVNAWRGAFLVDATTNGRAG